MEHFGDITKISGFEVPIVDIVTGGSPCQDLSVAAATRMGLNGKRSGLFMEQIRIIKEMRENDRANGRTNIDVRPRYMVWENVYGAFNSNKGEDFRCVLEETAKISEEYASIPRPEGGKWSKAGCIVGNGWSIAWRLHDAQFWGVPQRRKRICLLADFNGDTAPRILFELFRKTEENNPDETLVGVGENTKREIQPFREGLSGNIEQGEQERKETTRNFGAGVNPSSYTLKIRGGREIDSYGKRAGKGALIQTELSGTLGVSQDQTLITGCENKPMVCFRKTGHPQNSGQGQGWEQTETQDTLNAFDNCEGRTPTVILKKPSQKEDLNFVSLDCSHADDVVRISDSVPCMQGRQVKGGNNVLQNSVVRRLTPLECERLQGYPDEWTNIGEWKDRKGKKHKDADSPRYKALGNSIALPFWRWLAERIVSEYDRQTTMASLFDGIGGFPLVFSDFGCEPLWASEIEEFPIAVTKMRFK